MEKPAREAQHLMTTRLEVLSEHGEILGAHVLERDLTLIGRSPKAHIHVSGKGMAGFHLAIKRGKTQTDPLVFMDLGGPAEVMLNGKAVMETQIADPGVYHFEIGENKLRVVRKKLEPLAIGGANAKPGARLAAEALDLFPKDLRKPFLISSLITLLLFFAWYLAVDKPEPKVEEPYSLYARIQNVPIEKIPDAPTQAQSAGGGSGAPSAVSTAAAAGNPAASTSSKLAASLTGGLKSLMGGILSQSKVASNAVVSETGVGQALAVAGHASAAGKLAAVGSGAAALAGAAKLGALSIAGSGKGFGGGTGTGLGTGIGAGVGSGVGNGIGGGGFRLVEEESIVDGGLDKSVIAAVIQNNLAQIKYCYERQLVADPDLFGKVVVKWDINGQGLVEGPSVKQTTLNSNPVEQCMLTKISGWKFPQPKNGSRVTVTYPFLFKSTR